MSQQQSGLKLCKLVTNEFIIGRIIENHIINCLLVTFTANPTTGKLVIKLIPYMSPLDNGLNHIIDFNKIISMTEPSIELIQNYVSVLTTFISDNKKEETSTEPTSVENSSVPSSTAE